ncbi:hypothetical protein [Bacillus sp. MMSF_3353]|uniref:hypothetical protein n=1 Tax=Bacillus sp. MMSF_3353 TaxID=3047081 RepID=UPI00273DE00E|nr:hypothetical protein [Bacillus sp. MMSF_3353]
MNYSSRNINEKEIRPFVIEVLRDYRLLKVKFQNIQERSYYFWNLGKVQMMKLDIED